MQRTFVKFGTSEIDFIRTLQRIIRAKTKTRAPLTKVLSSIVRDYRKVLEQRSDPAFLEAYIQASHRRRRKRSNIQ